MSDEARRHFLNKQKANKPLAAKPNFNVIELAKSQKSSMIIQFTFRLYTKLHTYVRFNSNIDMASGRPPCIGLLYVNLLLSRNRLNYLIYWRKKKKPFFPK